MYLKSKKSVIFSIVMIIGVWGSKSFASGDMSGKNMLDKVKNGTSNRLPLSGPAKASVVKVLEANEELHSAFFNYDAKKVEEGSKKLSGAIGKIKDPKVSKLLKLSNSKLLEIKATNDREVNNKNYHLVSKALIHVVNTFDVGKKYNAYSCPMVKKKWVQNSLKMDKVHNPYAPEMPHCGTKDSKY